jgi:hypothetical protein
MQPHAGSAQDVKLGYQPRTRVASGGLKEVLAVPKAPPRLVVYTLRTACVSQPYPSWCFLHLHTRGMLPASKDHLERALLTHITRNSKKSPRIGPQTTILGTSKLATSISTSGS